LQSAQSTANQLDRVMSTSEIKTNSDMPQWLKSGPAAPTKFRLRVRKIAYRLGPQHTVIYESNHLKEHDVHVLSFVIWYNVHECEISRAFKL
jgi:hypothetical protein